MLRGYMVRYDLPNQKDVFMLARSPHEAVCKFSERSSYRTSDFMTDVFVTTLEPGKEQQYCRSKTYEVVFKKIFVTATKKGS